MKKNYIQFNLKKSIGLYLFYIIQSKNNKQKIGHYVYYKIIEKRCHVLFIETYIGLVWFCIKIQMGNMHSKFIIKAVSGKREINK